MTTTSTGISEKRKAALIEQHRHINVDYDWWDCTYDDFIETAKAKGFYTTTKDMSFSGFWSQGDGASFTGGVDVPAFIAYVKAENAKLVAEGKTAPLDPYPWIDKLYQHGSDIEIKVVRNSRHYAHENTCGIDIGFAGSFAYMLDDGDDETRSAVLGAWDEALSADIDQLEKDIESTRYALCRELYRSLESEYEHLTSDDAVWDTIEANDLHQEEDDE
jgi:hypothetical protein